MVKPNSILAFLVDELDEAADLLPAQLPNGQMEDLVLQVHGEDVRGLNNRPKPTDCSLIPYLIATEANLAFSGLEKGFDAQTFAVKSENLLAGQTD